MKRKICTWMIAAAAALCFTTPVTAAVSQKAVQPGYRFTDTNGDGICDYFTDKDGDGICDNCTWSNGRGKGRYTEDKNGDGICDNYANRGRRGGCGRGYGRQRF